MLNEDCIKKILTMGQGADLNKAFLDLFRECVNEATIRNLPSVTLAVPMYDANSNPKPDEFLAEFHLVVRKVDEPATADDNENKVDEETTSQNEE